MSEEIIRETVQKEILNGIKKELDSTLIFTYIQSIEQENQQLKEVLDEIREYINKNSIYFATSEKVGNYFANCNCDDLLQILDKVKEC